MRRSSSRKKNSAATNSLLTARNKPQFCKKSTTSAIPFWRSTGDQTWLTIMWPVDLSVSDPQVSVSYFNSTRYHVCLMKKFCDENPSHQPNDNCMDEAIHIHWGVMLHFFWNNARGVKRIFGKFLIFFIFFQIGEKKNFQMFTFKHLQQRSRSTHSEGYDRTCMILRMRRC